MNKTLLPFIKKSSTKLQVAAFLSSEVLQVAITPSADDVMMPELKQIKDKVTT